MSSIAAAGVTQAMQQAVATMKAAAQSQQETAVALAQAIQDGAALAQAIEGAGQMIDVSV